MPKRKKNSKNKIFNDDGSYRDKGIMKQEEKHWKRRSKQRIKDYKNDPNILDPNNRYNYYEGDN